ncbi:Type II secretion system protein F [bioreactor metagenome]|uniref:Type II secretion system protein F n=1 Tax=bioreactor metagenome TaxID=1076179 RepID=A0A644T633_9ZZZZ|nr:type II secretion system F family protein [Candidatus Elulimicrobiales bacterium]
MMFKYKAIKADGTRMEGKIEAATEDDAIAILQDRQLIIVSVEQFEEKKVFGSPTTGFRLPFFGKKIKEKDIVVFSRQIATLFQSGVSALRSFRLVASETENIRLRQVLNAIGDDIQSGLSISGAMSKHDNVFGVFYSSMIKAGEESGKLDESFLYLADYLDRNYDLTQKVKKATAYPSFVIAVFVIVMGVVIAFVIPKFAEMLTVQDQELPMATKIIFGIGTFSQKYGLIVIIVLAVLAYYLYTLAKTPSGKQYLDYFKLKIPVLGTLSKKIFLSRLTDNIDTMLSSGVPIVRSLEITSEVVDNVVFKDLLIRVSKKVKGGKSLSQSFYEEEELPNILVQMTKIGEETGKLGYILKSLSTYYKREVSTAIDTTLSLIEPILIFLLAGGVGFLLAAVMIPMFSVMTGM